MSNEDTRGSGSIERLLEMALDRFSTELNVSLPGEIVSFDSDTQIAKVKPLVQRNYVTGIKNLPEIINVPIVHPRCAKAQITLPLGAGDGVLIVFSDRAIKNWVEGAGEPHPPHANRKHSLNDAFAIPGGYPKGKPASPQIPDTVEINLKQGTKINITNGTDDLVDLMWQLIDYIETTIDFANSGGATGPPTNATIMTTLKTDLEAFKP